MLLKNSYSLLFFTYTHFHFLYFFDRSLSHLFHINPNTYHPFHINQNFNQIFITHLNLANHYPQSKFPSNIDHPFKFNTHKRIIGSLFITNSLPKYLFHTHFISTQKGANYKELSMDLATIEKCKRRSQSPRHFLFLS